MGIFVLLGTALALPMALAWTGRDVTQGDAVRFIYLHVPAAWTMYLSVFAVFIGSVMWLRRRSVFWDMVAEAASEIGVVFALLVLVTGALWGNLTWGTYWEWDARMTSTAVLTILLAGHVALRQATPDVDGRATRSAWLGLALLPNAIIVHYAVDWWRGLHQEATIGPTGAEIQDLQLFTWMFSAVIMTTAWAWLMTHRFRVGFLARQLDVGGVSTALAERRAEADRTWVDQVDRADDLDAATPVQATPVHRSAPEGGA